VQVTIALFLLHANTGRYHFLVTKGNSTLAFHKGVNSTRADESSPLVPTRCLLSLVSNGNLILFFYVGVNSVTALKLSAIVPRILNKKEAFISGRFLRLSSSSLFIFIERLIYDFVFCPILLKAKGMKTSQMLFGDCVGPS